MDEVIFGPVQFLVIVFDNPSLEVIPEGTAAILIIEHPWAKSLKQAIRGAGGVLVSQGMLTPELPIAVGEKLAEAVKFAETKKPGSRAESAV